MSKQEQQAFDVYLDGKLIDTVFAQGYTVEEMTRSLISHDGYDSGIKVKKARKKKAKNGNPSMARLEIYSPEDLADMPTLSSGQADDLKVEEKVGRIPTRWWLSRMSVEDGEEYAVHVEQLTDGRWEVVHDYGEPRSYDEMFGNPAKPTFDLKSRLLR